MVIWLDGRESLWLDFKSLLSDEKGLDSVFHWEAWLYIIFLYSSFIFKLFGVEDVVGESMSHRNNDIYQADNNSQPHVFQVGCIQYPQSEKYFQWETKRNES